MANYSNITDFSELQNGDTVTFDYTGSVVALNLPYGTYRLKCYGAQGGYRTTSTSDGQGGYAEGILKLKGLTPAYIYVGGSGNTCGMKGGFNGGGSRTNNLPGGGGASDIRLEVDSLFSRVIVAGGGGSDGASNKMGGSGGGLTGLSRTESYGTGGAGGTQTSGGAGGKNNNGDFGKGGDGLYYASGYGGAGGGGWYGGGGVYPNTASDNDRGGGGGSGYVLTHESYKPNEYLLGEKYYLTETVLTQGGRTGDGMIIIEIIVIGRQKFLARDTEGVKSWSGSYIPARLSVIAEKWTETTGGTSLSASVAANAGNTVVAVVTTRSETTFSNGWSVISSIEGFATSSQNLYVLTKGATSANVEITVTQKTSARIYIQLISFNKVISLTEYWKTSSNNDDVEVLAVSDKPTASKILWALSANIWSSISPFGKWVTEPNDLERYSSPLDVQDRQAIFLDKGFGSTSSRTFTPNATTGVGAIMLQIEEEQADSGEWQYVSDAVFEETFLEYGIEFLPQSLKGLCDEAEILFWSDRANVIVSPTNFELKLTANLSPQPQTIRQIIPFDIPANSDISKISLVKATLNDATVVYNHYIENGKIYFEYTLEKNFADAISGIKKINIYFTEV